MTGLFFAALLFLGGTAHADDTSADLYRTKVQVETVSELEADGVITAAQAVDATDKILREASNRTGSPVMQEKLAAVQAPIAGAAQQPGWLQRAAGLLTFLNAGKAFAVLAGAAAFLYLFGRAIVRLVQVFAEIPPIVYKTALAGGGIGLSVWGASRGQPEWSVGLAGAVLYGAGIAWTVIDYKKLNPSVSTLSATLGIAWSVSAVAFDSQLIGAMAVAAFMSAWGFSAFFLPGLLMVGFKDDAAVPRATFAGLAFAGLFLGLRVFGQAAFPLEAFRTGSTYVGGIVGFLGLLIIASKWYEAKLPWLLRQGLFIGLAGAFLALGSTFGVSELAKIAGAFAVVYAMEKPYEILPINRFTFAVITLAVCIASYAGFQWANDHVTLVAPYLPL